MTLTLDRPIATRLRRPLRPWSRSQRALLAAASAVALAVAGWVVFHGPLDLQIYLWGGRAVAHDAMLYDAQGLGHWFTYPPFAAVAFAPLAHLPLGVAEAVWYAATVAALVYAVRACLVLAGRPAARRDVTVAVAAAGLLEPVWHTFALGQVNLILLALVLGDVCAIARGGRAGAGIGVAAAVKLTPALFAVVLLAGRQRRSAVTAGATFAACTALGAFVAPAASYAYWSHLFLDTGRVGATYISNQSPFGALARLLGGADAVGGWYVAIPVVTGLVGVAVAAAFARWGEWLAMAAVTGVTSLLVSPISWAHHWVWALPALVVLAGTGRRADRVVAVGSAVVFAGALPWLTPHGHGSELGWHGLVTVAANAYLLCGLALLVRLALLACSRSTAGRFPRAPSDSSVGLSRARSR